MLTTYSMLHLIQYTTVKSDYNTGNDNCDYFFLLFQGSSSYRYKNRLIGLKSMSELRLKIFEENSHLIIEFDALENEVHWLAIFLLVIWSSSFPRSINILNKVKYTNHLLIFLFSNVPFSKNKKLKRMSREERREGSERRGRKTTTTTKYNI